jgi:hypothetical protein
MYPHIDTIPNVVTENEKIRNHYQGILEAFQTSVARTSWHPVEIECKSNTIPFIDTSIIVIKASSESRQSVRERGKTKMPSMLDKTCENINPTRNPCTHSMSGEDICTRFRHLGVDLKTNRPKKNSWRLHLPRSWCGPIAHHQQSYRRTLLGDSSW